MILQANANSQFLYLIFKLYICTYLIYGSHLICTYVILYICVYICILKVFYIKKKKNFWFGKDNVETT